MATKTLQVNLVDLETLPVGAGTAVTGEVWASYSRQIRVDGKVVPVVQRRRVVPASGMVEFEVVPNDDASVHPDDRGFAVTVGWELTHRGGNGRAVTVREPGRSILVASADSDPVLFSNKVEAVPADPLVAYVSEGVMDAKLATLARRDAAPLSVNEYATGGINAAIAAARADGARSIRIPAGTHTLTGPIVDDTSDTKPGLIIEGDSRGSVLVADYSNAPIIDLDGAGVQGKFVQGGTIRNLTLQQTAGKTGVTGIRSTGVWHQKVENVLFSGLSGDGIAIPDRSDINANPDFWASVLWTIERCRMEQLGGWGINSQAGVGFSVKVQQSYVTSCAAGGIRAGGHYTHVFGGAVASCGAAGVGAGIFIEKQLGVSPHGVKVENVELDGNWNNQILLQAAIGFEVTRNRFVSRLADASNYRDRYIIQLGDSTQQLVEGGRIAHNAIAPTGTTQPLSFVNYFGANSVYNEEFGNFRTVTGVTGFGFRAGSTTGVYKSNASEDGAILWHRYGPAPALPAASDIYRGQVRMIQGGAGVADTLYICRKNASDAYEWVPLH